MTKSGSLNQSEYAAQYWWLMFCAGVLFFGLGVWILASPVSSYLSLSLLFAFGMIFSGLFELIFAIGNRKRLHGWGWTMAGGLIDVSLGSYLLNYPLLTMVVMPVIIGLWIMVRGFMAIGSSIELRAYGILDWVWLRHTDCCFVITYHWTPTPGNNKHRDVDCICIYFIRDFQGVFCLCNLENSRSMAVLIF